MSEGHPKDIKSNWKGINHNTEREISGAGDTGEYLDGNNGRVTSTRGNNMSFEKIRGEEVLHTDAAVPAGYWECIGSIDVKDQLFEIWVDNANFPDIPADPIIKVDGVTVANSPDLPFTFRNPVQMDKNDNCLGGEVFITDNNSVPMIFDILDMVTNSNPLTTKYFADFNLDLYTINLDAPLDIPIFTGLESVGGGAGLPVGQYQYALRYVSNEGDRTNFGPLTPPIPVLRSTSSQSAQYPSVKATGDNSNVDSQTSYGIKLKFRVTNIFNYDYIEVKRLSYNTNSGVDFVPVAEIVAKLDVSNGEISVREFIDPANSNVSDVLSADEDLNDMSSIAKAKGIRYHDKRVVLMNVEKESKNTDGVGLLESNGASIFPILEHIGKDGHSNPVNQAYKRNYTSGEKFSFAPTLFDGTGGRGFAVDFAALRNFQLPNRRDPLTFADSVRWSTLTLPSAANVSSDLTVGKTFEAFDLHDPISKTGNCPFKNIMNDPGLIPDDPLVANKTKASVTGIANSPCNDPDDSTVEGLGSFIQASEIGYKPFTPTNSSDDTDGHNYRVNWQVDPGTGTKEPYYPEGFSPDYFTKGVGVAGLSNIPSWAKAFSIGRSRPAGRVVCQGLGMYSMNPGVGLASSVSKEKDKMWFHSPDIDSGFVGAELIDDIKANPSEYSIQLISPLGYFSEVYGYDEDVSLLGDKQVDIMTYARVLYDIGLINPGGGVSDGIAGFTAYNRWRNSEVAGQGVFAAEGGNVEIPFDSNGVNVVTNDRGTHYELCLSPDSSFIYQNGTTGGDKEYDDAGMKDWQEPMYIVNIIQSGKSVIDQNIDAYASTGHYQKIDSIIGLGNGVLGQSFELVDERWQDCIPDLSSGGTLAAEEVFAYVRGEDKVDAPWMDVTFLSGAQITAIDADIIANGFYVATGGIEVVGMYTHTNVGDKDFSLVFNISGYTPASGFQIVVKYDNRRPLIVFGGDSSIGETIFSPIDSNVPNKNKESDMFKFDIGFPYRRYEMNPRQYIIEDTTGANKIQNSTEARLGFLRQMAVMYTCESRSSIQFAHNEDTFDQFFPLTNYVMRPNKWDETSFPSGDPGSIADDNNLFAGYFDDYPEEWALWQYGGIRFKQNINLDYAIKGPIEYASKPDFGFEEQNKFCTAVVWSLPRAINQQDSPGLKSFPSLNRFDITDDNGEIKKAWDAISGSKGDNLYAICDSGTCLLLTKKSILSNINGNDLTTLATDSFIGGEHWISHDVGLTGEMWRGAAEGSIEIPTESGNIKVPGIYMPNKESVYRLYNNEIKDIVKQQNYYDIIAPYLAASESSYPLLGVKQRITGMYNNKYNEYWLQIDTDIPIITGTPQLPIITPNAVSETFTFSQNTDKWQGTFDYKFDKYIQLGDDLLGSRGLETFKLDEGFVINGADIEFMLTQNTTPLRGSEMEFIKVQVDSDKKPTKVEFLDEDYAVMCTLDSATQGPLYLKDYSGWEQFIPRKDVGVSANRERIQSRLLIYKIFHNLAEDFRVIESIVQFKKIK